MSSSCHVTYKYTPKKIYESHSLRREFVFFCVDAIIVPLLLQANDYRLSIVTSLESTFIFFTICNHKTITNIEAFRVVLLL